MTTANLGYTVYILPYIEQDPLYKQAALTSNYDAGTNASILNPTLVPVYQCPSGQVQDSTYITGKTLHYFGNAGPRGTNPSTGTAFATTGSASHGACSQHGVLAPNSRFRLTDISDGTSNTIMLGEISYEKANCYRPWTRGWDGNAMMACKLVVNAINTVPYNGSNNFNDVSFGSQHTGGCNMAFGDGTVRFVSDTVTLGVLLSAASRNGSEPTSITN